jgi:calcineurin-like phosphoesterase family protein
MTPNTLSPWPIVVDFCHHFPRNGWRMKNVKKLYALTQTQMLLHGCLHFNLMRNRCAQIAPSIVLKGRSTPLYLPVNTWNVEYRY